MKITLQDWGIGESGKRVGRKGKELIYTMFSVIFLLSF